MKNGEWHEVEIYMPPRGIAALDSANVDKYPDGTPLEMPLDSLSKLWSYGGAWSGGQFGVACCGSEYDNAPSTDPLFVEHEYDAVAGFYVHYDFAEGGGAASHRDVW